MIGEFFSLVTCTVYLITWMLQNMHQTAWFFVHSKCTYSCSGDSISPTPRILCRTSEPFSKTFFCRLLMREAWWSPVDILRFVAAVFHSTKRWDFVCAPPLSKFSGRCPTFHLRPQEEIAETKEFHWVTCFRCFFVIFCSTHSHEHT